MRTVLVARPHRTVARALALSLCLLPVACGESTSDLVSVASSASDRTTTSSATVSTTSSEPATTTTSIEPTTDPAPPATDGTIERLTLGDCPNRLPGSSPAAFTGEGTYAAFVTGVDLDSGEVSLDIVQWLSGDEADAAYEAETGDDSGVPNDYWVVNESEVVRSLPVAAETRLWMVRLAEDESPDVSTGAFDELPGYLEAGGQGSIWWATLEADVVIELCEQFVP